jgi:hypothetical protein
MKEEIYSREYYVLRRETAQLIGAADFSEKALLFIILARMKRNAAEE